MSINRTIPAAPVTSTNVERKAPKANPAAETVSKHTPDNAPGVCVQINKATQHITADDTQDVDMTRVRAIQNALSSGEYMIDTGVIADALIENIVQPGY